MRVKHILARLTLGLTLVIAAAALCSASETSSPLKGADSTGDFITVGAEARPFALKDIKGAEYKLADSLGKKAVMIVFWSLFCGPCREEIPMINELAKEFADKNVEFQTINLDTELRGKAVRAYVEKEKLTFNILWEVIEEMPSKTDPSKTVTSYRVSDLYGAQGTPTVVIIGLNKKVVYAHAGLDTRDNLEKALKSAIGM